MENIILVNARDYDHAAHMAKALSNLLSSGYEWIVLGKNEDGLYKILVRGGQEDDRKTETVCRELSC